MQDQTTTLPATAPRERSLPSVFGRLRDEIDQLFDDITVPRPMRTMFHLAPGMGMHPALELQDRKDHYRLAAELPGMEEKDIDIELSDGVLSISGEKRDQSEEKSGDYLMRERSYGSFRRRLTLPGDIDPDSVEAKYRNGVLTVRIGKDRQAAERVRKIAVG